MEKLPQEAEQAILTTIVKPHSLAEVKIEKDGKLCVVEETVERKRQVIYRQQ